MSQKEMSRKRCLLAYDGTAEEKKTVRNAIKEVCKLESERLGIKVGVGDGTRVFLLNAVKCTKK